MVFHNWWNNLNSQNQIIVQGILSAVITEIESIEDNQAYKIAEWIIHSQQLLRDENKAFVDEFIKRCDVLLEALIPIISKDNVNLEKGIVRLIRVEFKTNIEIKAEVLGLILKQSDRLSEIIVRAQKIISGEITDFEADLLDLEEESKNISSLIEAHQSSHIFDDGVFFEWEINLQGCPNLDCQAENSLSSNTCKICGVSLVGECPNCYNEIPLASSYCRLCGYKDLENWNIYYKFFISMRLALDKGLFEKAEGLLKQVPDDILSYPEIQLLKTEIEEVSKKEVPLDSLNDELFQKQDALTRKWVQQIDRMLSEKNPDFVLISDAFDKIPDYAKNDEIKALKQKFINKQQEVVEKGRIRKKTALLKKAEYLIEEGSFKAALNEMKKINEPLKDTKVLTKMKELKKLIDKTKEEEKLQELHSWAFPSKEQKKKAVSLGIKVAREIELTKSISLNFILIPDGNFQMGSNTSYENERPLHKVNITKPFYMAVTPVTQEQWEAMGMKNPSYFKDPKAPVEQVSWETCCLYLMALTKKFGELFRLPTEAEWEYCCRAKGEDVYCFGSNLSILDEYAWYRANAHKKTHPVATKRANNFGLFDMHGNVYEWCQDNYMQDYYKKSPAKDPMGPLGDKNSYRVYRGGAWNSVASSLHSSTRNGGGAGTTDYTIGFRPILVPSYKNKEGEKNSKG